MSGGGKGRHAFPSGRLDQVALRLPDGMRDRIKAEAEANNRSMNAEIVARLEASASIGLRDFLAAHALATLIGNKSCQKAAALDAYEMDNTIYDQVAWHAYRYADAMLAMRGDTP